MTNHKDLNFIWPGLGLPFLVECRKDDRQITVRTWRLSASPDISNRLPSDEAKARLDAPVRPFKVDRNPLGVAGAANDLWIEQAAVSGSHEVPQDKKKLLLKPISQVGFVPDRAILGSHAWSDYGLWLFNCSPDGVLKAPYNRFVKTQPTKEHRQLLLASREESNLLMMCVPFACDSLNQCSVILKYNPDFGCIHNLCDARALAPERHGFQPYDMERVFGIKALLPSLRLSGPDVIRAGEMARFSVELFDRNSDTIVKEPSVRLYLEANAGYLPQRQVCTRDGIAQFNLLALGLEPGDAIKLKVGWRNYSGADENLITVI